MKQNILKQINLLLELYKKLYKKPFKVMIVTFCQDEATSPKKILISNGKKIQADPKKIWELSQKAIKPEMEKTTLRNLAKNFCYIQRITIWN
ncbi:hypothetical protein ACFL23_00755 [Patescibacteria group bacterium]